MAEKEKLLAESRTFEKTKKRKEQILKDKAARDLQASRDKAEQEKMDLKREQKRRLEEQEKLKLKKQELLLWKEKQTELK